MDPQEYKRNSLPSPFGPRGSGYDPVPLNEQHTAYAGSDGRQFSDDQGHLLADASSFGRRPTHERSISNDKGSFSTPSPDYEQHAAHHQQQTGYMGPPGYASAPWQPQRPGGGQAY